MGSSVVDDTMTAESDSKSHVWINDNPRKYSFYRCGCGERMIYDDDKNYFECPDCRAIWDGKKYLGLDEVWNNCKNCGVNFAESMRRRLLGGSRWCVGAESFEAVVVERRKPKGIIDKILMKQDMMMRAQMQELDLRLDTNIRLGLISEAQADEIME